MRLSYSLNKNIFEATVGSLVNKLHLSKRRDTLFFEDIFINYIKECEDAGHGEEMKRIGQKWMAVSFKTLMPSALERLPPVIILNMFMKNVWINLGLMKNFHANKTGDIIEIRTENEAITKVIGNNYFSVGLFIGILNIIFGSQVDVIEVSQREIFSKYVFKIKHGNPYKINSKSKKTYDKLNYLAPIKGFTLRDSFKRNIFQLKEGNKIYFRDKSLYTVENTIFHLLGNSEILLERIPYISYDYFKEIIRKSSSKEKFVLLKTLLQIMGWGIITVVYREDYIVVDIKNPPFGLQKEKDNWNFLIQTILGYLWVIDKKFNLGDVVETYKNIKITYSKN
ncbi:MAG: hypothetical protein KAT37_00660 [Candidatus Aenigmarchaeota archaeon]|nr:hypothetical protein [Candidatus Aenigmarchaeota archaeon]